ncbi:dihydrolipoamide acetyltransferase family protein [Mesobacillus zeae]|uniref:Dihydrolipoamide acetyltransferase component of pyruvate dehydrogenase complex n=1 Tax=Mesobacillus zeae TaxID=1917180 RepID=A0A398BGB7_9BACI|nr:dihydrolipoamide acetyltransferase family protein [Mesobacillus zeae]RID87728.1 2-oxo acid dehydrogenase subunit E2 [Mesobacillus zeae]
MVEVKLHDIGEGMTEAGINCYLVKAGDIVKADDPLVEVQTDKMTAEIPAPQSGVIKQILLNPGETAKVGATLLIMEELDSARLPESGQGRPKRILASPYTRKIARENHVNIMEVSGTGPAGRIMDHDVLGYMKRRDSDIVNVSEAGSEFSVPELSEPASGGTGTIRNHSPKASNQIETDTLPFRGRRKQIAKKMVQSLYTIPHCTHFEEIDVSDLISFRQELKAMNQSVSATAFFIKGLSLCLKEFPVFNAKLDEEHETIQLLREHHIGLAVDTPEGLIVPVIRNVEQKNVKQIHSEMKRLTKLAFDDKLTAKDISGGTFTISNVGPLGGSIGATPIIQHPQTALVSFHKTKKRPVVTDQDEIAIRSMMNISMAFDHRVADGATAVSFTNRFAQCIENPKMMLLELI